MTTSSVYRLPGFAAFLAARLLAVFAMQIQAVVVAWQVYDITRDPLSLAYVGLAQFVPMLCLLLPAGDLIDRYDRKLILALSWLLEAACAAALLWLSLQGEAVSYYYGVLVLYGCARAFTGPALSSLLPQIVPRKRLAAAIAANSMIMRVATIGGPVLGGALYALGGGALTYGTCLVGFVVGTLLLWRVPVRFAERRETPTTGAWTRFTAGIGFIRSRPIILGTISLDLFAVLLGGVVALLPIYAQDVLEVGPTGLGLLRSAMAIGEVAVGLYLSVRPFDRHVGRVMFIAVALFGLANLVFALSTLFWLSFAALVVAGAADMVSVYIRSSLIQFSTPDAMRGRVNAVNMLFIGSSNELGEFRAGLSAAWLGAVPAALLGCACTLAVTGGWALGFKSLRQVNRFEDAAR
ncbi:MFS transporter [Stutzerimonas degradans]|uniref:MFS transporter n=1 Tax=Stutzerimonas degradans TaxID=2968968 RepID=A0A8E2QER3_9GAMM|nr:MFS transporter [Stutzerimonas degradans]MCQ4276161.1 MFS transporter [Stutzerimonas degradans]PNF76635.1 MFS transporter [Stutzerimonas degradans]QPT22596.1 MFS transporter [Stutzerimonas degradans]